MPAPDFENLSAGDKRLVNQVCERFEADLHVRAATRAEHEIGNTPEPVRSILAFELLLLECEYRLLRFEHPTVEEIAKRFPDLADLAQKIIDGALANALRSASSGKISDVGLRETIASLEADGRFHPIRPLGAGGFGVVFLAEWKSRGELVAIKVPRPGLVSSPELRHRFLRESIAARGLDHPNIVRVLDAGEIGGRCFLTSEFVAGPNLADWIRNQVAGIPAEVAAGMVRKLAWAMSYAHSRGVLHCDLKPANVLMCGEGISEPMVTDFGLALLASEINALSQTGVILGTPPYMAPELATGERDRITAATDVYSLGAILYELLVGRPPFPPGPPYEVLYRVVHEEPCAPRLHRPQLARALEVVCLHCLEKNPANRYPTAEALAEDLGRFMGGERTRVRPPIVAQRLYRWIKRHPIYSITGFFISLLISVCFLLLVSHNRELDSVNSQLKGEKTELQERKRQLSRIAYAAQMRQAAMLLEQADRRAVADVLDAWQPTEAEPDQRGFEWYYLKRQLGLGQLASLNCGAAVFRTLFLDETGMVATAGADRAVRLFDPATGRETAERLRHPGDVNDVVYDKKKGWLISACDDGHIRVWTISGNPVADWPAHKGRIHALALDANGDRLLSGGDDGHVREWDLTHAASPSRTLTHSAVPITALAFLGNRRAAAVGSKNGMIEIWNLETNDRMVTWRAHRNASVAAIRTNSGGHQIISGGKEGWVHIWELTPDLQVREVATLPKRFEALRDVALGSDGDSVAVTYHGPVEIWSCSTTRRRCSLRGHSGSVRSAVFDATCGRLVTSGADGTVRIWDLRQVIGEQQPLMTDSAVESLAFAPDGRSFATVDGAGRGDVWALDGESARRVGQMDGCFRRATVGLGATSVVAVNRQNDVWEWIGTPAERGAGPMPVFQPRPLLPLSKLGSGRGKTIAKIEVLNFGRLGRLLVTSDADGIYIWRIPSGELMRSLPAERGATSFAISNDGKLLAAWLYSRRVQVWDLDSGEVRTTITDLSGPIERFAFGPNGLLLAMSGMDGAVRVWDVAANREYGRLVGHQGEVSALAFAPDGRTLASGGVDGTFRLWSVATALEMMTIPCAEPRVSDLQFSPDGRYLVAVCSQPQRAAHSYIHLLDCGRSLVNDRAAPE